jgi:predicted DNA binding CopG/RHH family protein
MKRVNVLGAISLMTFLLLLFPVNLFAQNNLPNWLSNPPVAPGTIYGIGHAKLTDSKLAANLAEEKAVLSAVYEAQYLATIEYEYLNQPPEFEFIEEVKSINIRWNVSDIEIIKREQTSDGTWWCLAVYKKPEE